MKKKLLLLLLAFNFTIYAQTLFNENSTALTIGNVGTDLTGLTAGQGGWTTFVAATAVPAGQNSDFQIIDGGGTFGNSIQITGSSSATGTRWMTKNLITEWGARTTGNNIAEVEFDFFTGTASTSKNTMRVVLYESSARLKMLAGLMITMDTREIRGLGYLDPTTLGGTGAIGNYSLTLGGTTTTPAALILTTNTWYKLGLSFNYTTGEIKVKELTGLFDRTFASSAAANDVGEVDILAGAGTANTVASIGVFDNLLVKASSTDTLLGVNNNTLLSSQLSIFPNPSNGIVTILAPEMAINSIEMSDINGRIVKITKVNGLNETQINVSDLAKGVYFLKIASDKGIATKKLVVE